MLKEVFKMQAALNREGVVLLYNETRTVQLEATDINLYHFCVQCGFKVYVTGYLNNDTKLVIEDVPDNQNYDW